MCGIAGILHFDGRPIDRRALDAMSESLAHRGPDGDGVFIDDGPPSVGLASRRLAVIDIPDGKQPMSIDEGAFTIVYNGELFNAAELRAELQARGSARFATRSDTEVVLRGYAEWGTGLLERMNGMWAFALWDRRRRRLFIARDRLGVKPLVYTAFGGGIAFGSEIKALTRSGVVQRRLDVSALPHYLSFFAVPEPYTLIEGVRRLPAGHAMLADESGARAYQYWDCALEEEDDRGLAWYRREIGELVQDSVRRRLVSDVDLGVMLSGGADSSLIATMACRGSSDVRTFTLGFQRSQDDERQAARRVADALGTSHTDAVVCPVDAAKALPQLLAAYDEPGQSLVQADFVSRLARQSVTVALSGLGGDELFAGYPTHAVVSMLARLDRVPRPMGATLLELSRLVPGRRSHSLRSLAAMASDQRSADRLLHQTSNAWRRDLLSSEVRAAADLHGPTRHLEQHFEQARARHPLNRLLYVYLKTYLTDELLRATDAMSMRHGLEVRTPFLDYRLVERAMRMPARHKMTGVRGKLILQSIASDVLPTPLGRVKHGFSLPLWAWLQNELRTPVHEMLTESSIRRRGVFDPDGVRRLTTEALNGNRRLLQPLMMLYSFEAWAQAWLDEPAGARVGGERAVEVRPARDLSVVIVNWNTKERLRACLTSLADHLGAVDHEVIVVDNASDDGSTGMVAGEFPWVRLIRNAKNLGFGAANNQAMSMARGRWLLLLNSDTMLLDDSVARLFNRLDAGPGDIGVAQCRLRFPDGRLQHSAYRFPRLWLVWFEAFGLYKLLPKSRAGELLLGGYWDYGRERNVDWVSGAFMLLPREVFTETGGFDEHIFMYGEDLEWSYRIAERGWRIRYFPTAEIVHFDHSSSDLMWGGRPIARCLESERDVYRDRFGRPRARGLLAGRLVNSALRAVYYGVRAGLSRADAYRYEPMRRASAVATRALLELALRRT